MLRCAIADRARAHSDSRAELRGGEAIDAQLGLGLGRTSPPFADNEEAVFHFTSRPYRYSALAGFRVFALAGKDLLSQTELATRLRWQPLSRAERARAPRKGKTGALLPVAAWPQPRSEQLLSSCPLPTVPNHTVTVSIAQAPWADWDSYCLDWLLAKRRSLVRLGQSVALLFVCGRCGVGLKLDRVDDQHRFTASKLELLETTENALYGDTVLQHGRFDAGLGDVTRDVNCKTHPHAARCVPLPAEGALVATDEVRIGRTYRLLNRGRIMLVLGRITLGFGRIRLARGRGVLARRLSGVQRPWSAKQC